MANKKINQLVSKTAILSTDLFGIGDATTGQLFKKTIAELQAAIGGAVISVNGLVGTVVLDTDDIQELASPTNKYFTDARARGAISLTVTGNSGASTYSSGTGVLNVPTYTLAGLGGITASFLSGASGISYNSTTGVISYSGTVYTDASIRALLSGGTGISYNSSTGAISYSGTVYTDSSVRALISLTTTGTSGASTYNNTTGVINVPEYTLAGLGGISLTSLSGSGSVSYNSSTGVISSSVTQYTDALARASISLTTTGTSGASTYNSTTGVLNIPQYQSVLTNPVTGTGTTNYIAKFTSSSAIGNSSLTDDGTTITSTSNIYVNKANPFVRFKGSTLDGYIINSNDKLYIADYNTAAKNIVLDLSTGATTFSSSVTAGGNISITSSTGNKIGYNVSDAFTALGTSIPQYGLGYGWSTQPLGLSGYYGLAFFTNGSEAIRINTTNNIIIGDTADYSVRTHIAGAGATTSTGSGSSNVVMLLRDTTTGAINVGAGIGFAGNDGTNVGVTFATINGRKENSSTGNFASYLQFMTRADGGALTERLRVSSAGYLGLGTSSPATLLHLNSPSIAYGQMKIINTSTTGDAGIQMGKSNQTDEERWTIGQGVGGIGNNFGFYASGASNLNITNGGNILMGTNTNNGERLYVSGNIRATGTITANSDISLKKNLLKIENALEKVEQINGYTYEFKEDDSKRHAGVIAQEIQTVLPEIVNKGNDGILGVEYGNISALLIEAIKEQQTQINELKALLNK